MKDITTKVDFPNPGDDQLPAEDFNQPISELENAITNSGISLSGADLAQLSKGISQNVADGSFYTTGGTADAITLAVQSPRLAPPALTNGFKARFRAAVDNTSTVTVNVAGLGAVAIKKNGALSALVAGDILQNKFYEIVYNTTATAYELVNLSATNDIANLIATLPVQNIKNLILQPDADADHDTNFFRPNTNYPSQVIVRNASYKTRAVSYSGEMTKQINATWAVGDDAGGLDDNDTLAVDTLYYCFPLYKSTWINNEPADVGYTTDITGVSLLTDAAVIVAGFDEIGVDFAGTVLTNGSSNIISYKANSISGGGIKQTYASKIAEVSTGAAVPAFTPLTLSAPPNSRVQMYVSQASLTTATDSVVSVKEKDSGLEFEVAHTIDNASERGINYFEINTDSNSQIDYSVSLASDTLNIYTLSYILERAF